MTGFIKPQRVSCLPGHGAGFLKRQRVICLPDCGDDFFNPLQLTLANVNGQLQCSWTGGNIISSIQLSLGSLPVETFSGQSPINMGIARAGLNIATAQDARSSLFVDPVAPSLFHEGEHVYFAWMNGGSFRLMVTRKWEEDGQNVEYLDNTHFPDASFHKLQVGRYLAGRWTAYYIDGRNLKKRLHSTDVQFCVTDVKYIQEAQTVTWSGPTGVTVEVWENNRLLRTTVVDIGTEYYVDEDPGEYLVILNTFGCDSESISITVTACPLLVTYNIEIVGNAKQLHMSWRNNRISFSVDVRDAWGILVATHTVQAPQSTLVLVAYPEKLGAYYTMEFNNGTCQSLVFKSPGAIMREMSSVQPSVTIPNSSVFSVMNFLCIGDGDVGAVGSGGGGGGLTYFNDYEVMQGDVYNYSNSDSQTKITGPNIEVSAGNAISSTGGAATSLYGITSQGGDGWVNVGGSAASAAGYGATGAFGVDQGQTGTDGKNGSGGSGGGTVNVEGTPQYGGGGWWDWVPLPSPI